MTRRLRVFTSLGISAAVGCPACPLSGLFCGTTAVKTCFLLLVFILSVSLLPIPFVFLVIFFFSSKSLYEELRKVRSSAPPLHHHWKSLAPAFFLIKSHWKLVWGSFAENFKNDLFWFISLKAVKVHDSLCQWGYIKCPVCASCPRRETIDHCFLHCNRVRLGWRFFFFFLPSSWLPSCFHK